MIPQTWQPLFADTWSAETRALVMALRGPVLVLGASGFIGSKLLWSLSAIRDDVHGTSVKGRHNWRLAGWPSERLHACDLTHPGSIESTLDRVRPGTVFNLAAFGGYVWQDSGARCHAVNALGTFHLLKAMSRRSPAVLVHAGSSSEYGSNGDAPLESAPCEPISDYAISKLTGTMLVRLHSKSYGIPAVILRLYSVYGPLEDPGRMVPRLVQAGLAGGFPSFASSNSERDFVFVDEVTRAFVLAAVKADQLSPGEIFNIASGKSTSLLKISELARAVMGIRGQPSFGVIADRVSESRPWRGNPEKAQKLLGWSSQVALDRGLELTRDWEQLRRKLESSSGPKPLAQSCRKLSVVIACYRDAQAISQMHERLSRVFDSLEGIEGELIFINDGSPDADEQAIIECQSRDYRVLGRSHSRNFGSQAAFLSGMEIATGDAVVLMDGDLQDPPEVIPKFVARWNQGAEVVVGERVERRGEPVNSFFSKSFYRIFKKVVDFSLPVDAGDFSLMDRRVYTEVLRCRESGFFVRGLRAWAGFRQESVPYVREARVFGASTNSFFSRLGWAKFAIVNFSRAPVTWIQALGGLLVVGSILLWALGSVLAPGFLHLGVVLLSLGVIGEYSARTLLESKRRPHALIARELHPRPHSVSRMTQDWES